MTADRSGLADGALGEDASLGEGLLRLVAVMARLRRDCPWDAQQTHQTLVKHLIEETAEAVDAIEAGCDADMVEELGDVLLQVLFHAEIARGEGRFTIDDVAAGVADKLIARHPYIFGDADVPADMMATWEAAKRAAKHRGSSLDGIADALPALARAAKVATRLRDTHTDAALGLLAGDDGGEPPEDETPEGGALATGSAEFGQRLLTLVVEAVRAGVDPDQALRGATRAWERRVRAAGL